MTHKTAILYGLIAAIVSYGIGFFDFKIGISPLILGMSVLLGILIAVIASENKLQKIVLAVISFLAFYWLILIAGSIISYF